MFSIFFNMKACCVPSLESPYRDDSNEYTHHTVIKIKKKHPKLPNTIISAAMGCFCLGTQERVRNNRGKRAISVRATEVLLYM